MSETPEEKAAWDAAWYGDRQPAKERGRPCGIDDDGRVDQSRTSPLGFTCCRTQGHSGQHVATVSNRVLDVWPGEQP